MIDLAVIYLILRKYRVRFFLSPKVLKVSDQRLLVDDRAQLCNSYPYDILLYTVSCSSKRICCGSISSLVCQTSQSYNFDQKIPMKILFHQYPYLYSIQNNFAILRVWQKKPFLTEVKCRKCPAKEKGTEEGSKTSSVEYFVLFEKL